MAIGAKLRDAVILLAVGRDNATRQQVYFEQQTQRPGKGFRVDRSIGRAYHACLGTEASDNRPASARVPHLIVRLVKAPVRAVISIGQYDMDKTR